MKINALRIPACLLAVLTPLSAVSCGSSASGSGTTTPPVSDTTAAPEASRLDELATTEYRGRTFTIMDANDYPATHVNMPESEANGDYINDGLYNRNKKIEDLFGISIEYVQQGSDDGINTVRSAVLAGEKAYSLIFSAINGGRLATLATEGLLANLCETPDLTLDANWWSSLMYDSFRFDDRMYFTSGDISPTMYKAPAVVYLNQKLLGDYRIDTDFYQLVRDGAWTMDELYKITRQYDQDINADSVMHTNDDFFGLVYQRNELTASLLLTGCGVELCSTGGDSMKLALNDERTASVVDKLRQLCEPISYDNHNDIYNKAFLNDRAIAMIHFAGTAQEGELRGMESDYSMLPIPKYDEKQENYHSFVNGWCTSFVGIPMDADPAFTGRITESLAWESYTTIRPTVYDLIYKQKAARDEGSAEMLDIIFNTVYLDFASVYDFGGITGRLVDVVFNDAPLTSTIAGVQASADAAIRDFVRAWTE